VIHVEHELLVTAEQLVADHKTDAVLAYLRSVRGGSTG
jgi:hypothetical protein